MGCPQWYPPNLVDESNVGTMNVTAGTAVHQITALLSWMYALSLGTFTSTRASSMLLH